MIIEPKNTMVAYRCPECGMSVMSMIGVFALSGDLIKLKCNCGNSELQIVYTSEKKVRLNVPCLICEKPHNYLISSDVFFSKDLFTLGCSFSGMDICFIGTEKKVLEALEESQRELTSMLEESGAESFSIFGSGSEQDGVDSEVISVVSYVLQDLIDCDGIECGCTDKGDIGHYTISYAAGNIIISCDKCGKSFALKQNSSVELNDFIGIEHLTLN